MFVIYSIQEKLRNAPEDLQTWNIVYRKLLAAFNFTKNIHAAGSTYLLNGDKIIAHCAAMKCYITSIW